MSELIYQTYIIALPIILTALMGYIVWLLKNQKKDPRAMKQNKQPPCLNRHGGIFISQQMCRLV